MSMRFLIIIMVAVFSGSTIAETFSSQHYHFHVEKPSDWQIEMAQYDKSMIATLPELPATINVTAYRFEEPVTANGLKEIRMGSRYDGWLHLLSRSGTLFETNRANVQESCLAVYAKDVLNERMEMRKKVVGEYYFVTGNYAYTITASTFQDHWAGVQPVLKRILDSFWVGSGERPIVKKTVVVRPSLNMPGYDLQNRNLAMATPNIHRVLTTLKSWSFDVTGNIQISPVVMDGVLVLALPNQVQGIALDTLETVWQFSFPFTIRPEMVAHHGLVTILRAGSANEVLSLDIQTGEVVYTIPLDSPVTVPLVYENQLLFGDSKAFYSMDAITGKRQWKKSIAADHEMQPIITDSTLVVSTVQGVLMAMEVKKGALLWETKLSNRLKYAMVASGGSVMGSIPVTDKIDRIESVDIANGNVLWAFDQPLLSFRVSHPVVADSRQLYVISQIKEDILDEAMKSVLMAFNLDSGELNWSIDIGDVRPLHRPTVLKDSVILISDNKYWVIDSITGEFFQSVPMDQTLLSQFMYKDFVLQWGIKGSRYQASVLK